MCRSKAEGGRRIRGRAGLVSSVAVDDTAGSAAPGPSGRMRRSREAVLRAAQKQLGDYLDAVVDAVPVDSAGTLVSAAEADAAGQVADAITATLEGHGCPRGRWQSHLLCGALAAVAQAMKAGEDLAKTAVTASVRAALTACRVPRLAAGLAGRAARIRAVVVCDTGGASAITARRSFTVGGLGQPAIVSLCRTLGRTSLK